MARSWVGLTILACLPCMVPLQWTAAYDSYANYSSKDEYYQSAVVSTKNVAKPGATPPLIHKGSFAYEYGRGPPGVAPDTRSACPILPARSGICVMRRLFL